MIAEVTDTLVDVIAQATPDINSGTDWVEVISMSGADADPGDGKLSVALYAVEQHPHTVNRPLVNGRQGYTRAPLFLRLHYLMSYSGAHREAQLRLSRVAQALHTTPIIGPGSMTPALAAEAESLTMRLVTTTADERNQIWGALGRSGRLALFYQVDVAPIELLEREGAGAISTHRVDYVGTP